MRITLTRSMKNTAVIIMSIKKDTGVKRRRDITKVDIMKTSTVKKRNINTVVIIMMKKSGKKKKEKKDIINMVKNMAKKVNMKTEKNGNIKKDKNNNIYNILIVIIIKIIKDLLLSTNVKIFLYH